MVAASGTFAFPNIVQSSSLGDKQSPNIIYIFTDQQTAGAMSCTGNSYLKTPAMDSIASKGIRFHNAYCTDPLCAPSRASMWTGLLPHKTGVLRNHNKGIDKKLRHQEMGWLFKNAGYECVYGGKWHLWDPYNIDFGHGFRNISPLSDEYLTQACVKFLHEKHKSPFLMVASYFEPHSICGWNRPAESMVKNGLNIYRWQAEKKKVTLDELLAQCPPLPANFSIPDLEPEWVDQVRKKQSKNVEKWNEDCWRIYRWIYYRYVERLDIEIGKILQALKDSGLQENTMVVFSSDHGEGMGSHRWLRKRCFYDESVKIPLIFSYEGIPRKGKVDHSLVSNGLDLLPTLCDYAGIKIPQGLHGRSLRPLMENSSTKPWREDITAQEYRPQARMLRTNRYKYIVYKSKKHREQLIDLIKDPGEMVNLAENPDYQHILEDHRKRLLNWCIKTEDSQGKEIIRGPSPLIKS
jgi:arylsulfatase A-like enzyme